MDESSLTVEEIAAKLKISKLKVYDLIKKGELTAYRVGKQMRVDETDLEAYKRRLKGAGATGAATEAVSSGASGVSGAPSAVSAAPVFVGAATGSAAGSIIITGHDVSLDILAKHLEKRIPGVRPLRSFVGSMDSLVAMYRGEADIVSTHLLDGDTGEYNIPYIRKLLVGQPCLVVNLASRTAGLYVRKGNPHGLRGWGDLERPGLRFANRERGSGARVLLDEQLRLHGIDGSALTGYDAEETSHFAVAGKVASGAADVGVGIEKAAQMVGGDVQFIPLIRERYDLVMLKRAGTASWREAAVETLRSAGLRAELASIQGYDLSLTGQVLYES